MKKAKIYNWELTINQIILKIPTGKYQHWEKSKGSQKRFKKPAKNKQNRRKLKVNHKMSRY